MHDFITVARCSRHRTAQKTYRMTDQGMRCEPYDTGKLIVSEAHCIDSLRELHELLEDIETHPRMFVLRGGPADHTDTSKPHIRRYLDRTNERTGAVDLAPYKACDHHWMMVDIDDLLWPGYRTPECIGGYIEDGDGEAIAAHVLEQLPEYFHGVRHIWHFSSSAGVDGWEKVKLHLWLWSDRPVCGFSLREWMKRHAPCVDTALFQPVQPHYTARPRFEGMADPLKGEPRLGFVPGRSLELPREVVTLERYQEMEADALKRARATMRASAHARRWCQGQRQEVKYARGALKSACETVVNAPVGERHNTLRHQSLAIHRFVASGDLSWDEYHGALMEAVRATFPQREWRTEERTIYGAREREQGVCA